MFKSPAIEQALLAAEATDDYDVFWFSGGGTMNHHLVSGGRIKVLADVVDDPVLTQLRVLRGAGDLVDKVRHAKRLLSTYLFERRTFVDSDVALFVADEDAAMFRRVCPSIHAAVINNGVDVDYFQPQVMDDGTPRVVFEGNMGFHPNVEAALHFSTDILPLIRMRIPDIRFDIVGRDPAPAVCLQRSESVGVTGFVDDIRPYLARPAVFVCPMRSGAGIKNKLLQAWAMALPVVASSMATGGLIVDNGRNILIRDDPHSFADAVVQVLSDRRLAEQLGDQGRLTVEAHYTWAAKSREMEQVFEATVASRRQRSGAQRNRDS